MVWALDPSQVPGHAQGAACVVFKASEDASFKRSYVQCRGFTSKGGGPGRDGGVLRARCSLTPLGAPAAVLPSQLQ